MESIVPIFGHEVLDRNRALKNRIKSIVEDDFGHTVKFADAGSIAELHHADPLRTVVPFTITVAGVLDRILKDDFLSPLSLLFPQSDHIEMVADHIPAALKVRAEALSLGHVNGGPAEVRRAMKLIYKYLSKPDFNVAFLSHAIGLSRSTLERAFNDWRKTGVGHTVHEIKLSEARRMALTTGFNVEAISFAVGYENLSSFDRAFFREFGASVTTLRRNAKSLSQNAKPVSQTAH